MAIKDWKKTGKDTWRKINGDYINLTDTWGINRSIDNIKLAVNGVNFILWKKVEGKITRKEFKTKSEALRFVKSYMKKH
jgi:hypothetical protein